MIDNDPHETSPTQFSSTLRRGGLWLRRHWIGLAVFALALMLGTAVSMLWMHAHKAQPTSATAQAAATPDPTHPPLPSPMPGALSTLQSPAASAPGSAYIKPAPVQAPVENSTSPSESATAAAGQMEESPDAFSSSDIEPQIIKRTQPQYPPEALRAREEGEVQLQVSLDATGNIVDVKVTGSSHSRALDRAAMDAAHDWQFRPAIHNGMSVPSTMTESVDFHIDDQR